MFVTSLKKYYLARAFTACLVVKAGPTRNSRARALGGPDLTKLVLKAPAPWKCDPRAGKHAAGRLFVTYQARGSCQSCDRRKKNQREWRVGELHLSCPVCKKSCKTLAFQCCNFSLWKEWTDAALKSIEVSNLYCARGSRIAIAAVL